MDETGLENAAILLMSLGEEDAAEVLKHLTPKEVQGVGETIARMKSIPRERVAVGQPDALRICAPVQLSPLARTIGAPTAAASTQSMRR